MRRIASHITGVDQGDVVLFSDFEHDGQMWTGEGPRLHRKHVRFADAFDTPPAVTVGLSMWDMSNTANMRVDIQAEKVDRKGFDIVFRTWGDTKVARVRVAWLAIGAISDDEAWDI